MFLLFTRAFPVCLASTWYLLCHPPVTLVAMSLVTNSASPLCNLTFQCQDPSRKEHQNTRPHSERRNRASLSYRLSFSPSWGKPSSRTQSMGLDARTSGHSYVIFGQFLNLAVPWFLHLLNENKSTYSWVIWVYTRTGLQELEKGKYSAWHLSHSKCSVNSQLLLLPAVWMSSNALYSFRTQLTVESASLWTWSLTFAPASSFIIKRESSARSSSSSS